jgi:methyl-accepting chemotaxis protein
VKRWLRFRNWPLRAKFVALLAAASLVPLGFATWNNLGNARAYQFRNTEQLLRSRADMLARRIEALNAGYARSARLLALSSSGALVELQGPGPQVRSAHDRLQSQVNFWTQIDPTIRGVALLDATGNVVIATEPELERMSLARYGFVRKALQGNAVISDVFIAELRDAEVPTIAYLAPIRSADAVLGVAALWVDASHHSELLSEVNDDVGVGSFAVLLDSLGIRIAHSRYPEAVYRPARQLEPADLAVLTQERRFGSRTTELITNVAAITWRPAVDWRDLPDVGLFRARGLDGYWLRSVGQRTRSVDWIVFFQIPESVLEAGIASIMHEHLLFAAVIMVMAMGVGLLFADAILQPVQRLTDSARAIGAGNFDSRVNLHRGDELGELGANFNYMATRIQEQAAALQRESADQYRMLFQTMSEGFCSIELILDAAGEPVDFMYCEANHEFEMQTGLHNVVGRRKSEIGPNVEAQWLQTYARVTRTGEPAEFEIDSANGARCYHVRTYRVGGSGSLQVAVLFDDITERRQAQNRQQAQLESLNLLHRITHAIGERQDLPSIFQVVLHSIEAHLSIDFGCVCLLDSERHSLEVARVGERSQSLARQMAMAERQSIAIDADGLARCVRGELVYVSAVHATDLPFLRCLADTGLSSVVLAPLLVENRVFGVLITARREHGFSNEECEFLRRPACPALHGTAGRLRGSARHPATGPAARAPARTGPDGQRHRP